MGRQDPVSGVVHPEKQVSPENKSWREKKSPAFLLFDKTFSSECCKLTSLKAELILLLALVVVEGTDSHLHGRRSVFIKGVGVSIGISGREGVVGLFIRPIRGVALVFLVAAHAENQFWNYSFLLLKQETRNTTKIPLNMLELHSKAQFWNFLSGIFSSTFNWQCLIKKKKIKISILAMHLQS